MVSTHDWILAVGNTSPPKSKTTDLTEAIMNHLPNGIVENAEHIELIEGLLSTALGDRVVFQKKPPKITVVFRHTCAGARVRDCSGSDP